MSDRIEINGFCGEAFLPIREAFEANFRDGMELGASVAATHHGKPVVDLWAGHADATRSRPWQKDTIVCVASSTKIPTIVCVLMAVDRGLLDLDTPVAHYWPEFAAHGKGEITVREALTHRALVPGFATPQPWDTPMDWNRMTSLIAAEKPWFERGRLCYHALTYGHLLGELVQRATGVGFQEFFRSELADPLAADFHIGLRRRSDFDRLGEATFGPMPDFGDPEELPEKIMGSILQPPAEVPQPVFNNWEWISSPYPGSNGAANARSFARIGAMLAMGGTLDGKKYLSRELVDEAIAEQCNAVCPCVGNLRLGLGFGLDGAFYAAPTPTMFHWGGYGGSWCTMDVETQTSFAYAMNHYVVDFGDAKVNIDPRQRRIWDAISQICRGLGE